MSGIILKLLRRAKAISVSSFQSLHSKTAWYWGPIKDWEASGSWCMNAPFVLTEPDWPCSRKTSLESIGNHSMCPTVATSWALWRAQDTQPCKIWRQQRAGSLGPPRAVWAGWVDLTLPTNIFYILSYAQIGNCWWICYTSLNSLIYLHLTVTGFLSYFCV